MPNHHAWIVANVDIKRIQDHLRSFAIPAISVPPSEWLFSEASLPLTKTKARMDPANAATALFLQGNIDWHEQNEKDNDEEDMEEIE